MQGGQRERCASSAAAFSGESEPSTYSPRSSTQSEQCSKRLVIDVPLGCRIDAPPWRAIRKFPDRSLPEETAELLPERKSRAMQPALHRGNGQIERRRYLLVRQPIHVLAQE